MNKKIIFCEIASFIFISILGFLLHFAYDTLACNFFIGLFVPINESTWEHLKLAFLPLFVFALFEYLILKRPNNFWGSKLLSTITTTVLILLFSYIYMDLLKGSNDIIYIVIFYVALLIGSIISYMLLTINKVVVNNKLAFIFIMLILYLFMIFTIIPPRFKTFLDPVTNTYGIRQD